MIPVLHGVWASGGLAGDFEHIETQTVGAGGAASVTFSSIPGTYKHLQIRGIGKNATGSLGVVYIRFNGDSGNNYNGHALYGDGATAVSTVEGVTTGMFAGVLSGPTPTNVFAGSVIDILDYVSTSKNKVVRALGGADVNGTGGYAELLSGLWLSTAAVTSITVYGAANLAQYSSFSLYGVK